MTGDRPRPAVGIEARKRRLAYRAHHRGIKEMDLILGRFADSRLAGLDEARVAEFERLIEVADQQLYDWVCGRARVPGEFAGALMDDLMVFAASGAVKGD